MKYIAVLDSNTKLSKEVLEAVKNTVFCGDDQLPYCFDIDSVEEVTDQIHKNGRWIPCSERLPKPYEHVNCTCHSLIDDREDWVVETMYLPIPKEVNVQSYSDWGNIPILNWGKAEVIAWMHRDIPEPYKAERGSEEV